jgi:hypothetical protein
MARLEISVWFMGGAHAGSSRPPTGSEGNARRTDRDTGGRNSGTGTDRTSGDGTRAGRRAGGGSGTRAEAGVVGDGPGRGVLCRGLCCRAMPLLRDPAVDRGQLPSTELIQHTTEGRMFRILHLDLVGRVCAGPAKASFTLCCIFLDIC